MIESRELPNRKSDIERAIEIAVRIGVLGLLLTWCFLILKPFVAPVLWGAIIAVAIYSPFNKLQSLLGSRPKLAAALITLVLLAILVVPSVQLTSSLVEGVSSLREGLGEGGFEIAPPPENIAGWPLIGKPLHETWKLASENLAATLSQYAPQIKAVALWLLESIAGTGLGVLQFIFSIIIAGVFLASAQQSSQAIKSVFIRLAGKQGDEFAHVSAMTINNVVKGVLGVAVIQTMLAGLGFAVAKVPIAGLWALLCMILAIVQVGIMPVVLPVIIYMFVNADTFTATLLAIYLVFVGLVDNVLRPILLGRGAPVPMLVIFLGTLGGFITSGFVGLFIGAIILSLGYKLFLTWLHLEPPVVAQDA